MAKVIRNKKPKWRTVRHYTPIDSTCINCHKKDDKHKGDFGINCAQCHREKSWKYSKDFHKNFTLHGAHYTAECSECHNDNGKKLSGTSENCIYCHQKDDVHSGSLPNCNDCHRQQFWEHTRFRHSMTFFPLRGAHRTLDCFQCHNSNSGNVNNNQYEGTPADCSQCHATDRASVSGVAQPRDHTGATFDDCSQCHNQFSFDLGL